MYCEWENRFNGTPHPTVSSEYHVSRGSRSESYESVVKQFKVIFDLIVIRGQGAVKVTYLLETNCSSAS